MEWLIMTAKDFTGICGVPILDLLTPRASNGRCPNKPTLRPSNTLRADDGAIIVVAWNALIVDKNWKRVQNRVSASCRDILDACSGSRLLAVVVFDVEHRSPSQDLAPSDLGVKVGG
jgi:hypothetical protein